MTMIDDRSISKPPYSGPNTEPLPVRSLAVEDILALLDSEYPDEVIELGVPEPTGA